MKRFFDVASAQPLTTSERHEVSALLPTELEKLFFAQPDPDQRHGHDALRSVAGAGYGDGDVALAALLHDVGKRQARLGLIGRSVASLMILLRLPLPARMKSYRDHGRIGAEELSRAGSPPLVVEFARSHHGSRPDTIPAPIWDVLVAADQPPKARSRADGRITSAD